MNDYSEDEQHSTDPSDSGISGAQAKLLASTESLATQAEDLLQQTSSVSREGFVTLRERLMESLRNVRMQVGNARHYAMERGKAVVAKTDSYVHEKPWQVLAIAALFGMALGYASRKSRY